MGPWLSRVLLRVKDRVRYSRILRSLSARYRVLADNFSNPTDVHGIRRSIATLCAAARLIEDGPFLERIEKRLRLRVVKTARLQ